MSDDTGSIDLKGYHNRIRDGVCNIVAGLLPTATTSLHVDLIVVKVVDFAEEMTVDLH